MNFFINCDIAFTHFVSAFAMSKDYIFTANVEEHSGADFACESTFFFVVTILGAQCDMGSFYNFPYGLKVGERWAERDINLMVSCHECNHFLGQFFCGGMIGEHFPVACNKFLTHV